MSAGRDATPPRVRLTFRVGLVGHRPNRLPKDKASLELLRQTLRAILGETRQAVSALAAAPEARLYSSAPPELRAISSLAEGADRLFAEAALAEGFTLSCPMPFHQEEYEKDFAAPAALEPDSLAHFRALLREAGEGLDLFEMDGARALAPQAYSGAGHVVLNQSDLLIVVWDGGAAAGHGGTVETLEEALRYHVPVIWVDARAPGRWQVLTAMPRPGEAAVAAPGESLQQAVRRIAAAELLPPAPEQAATMMAAADYLAERQPRWNLAFFWKLFRDLVSGCGPVRLRFFVPRFEETVKAEWPTTAEMPATPPASDWVNGLLRPHFAWADGLADFYGDAHRSGFVLYLLSAAAVFTALLPLAAGSDADFGTGCAVAELLILAGILFLLRWARTRHWHERWTEYRLLAELIRELRFLIPLGGGKPLPRISAHLAVYGDPAQSWMYWHMRAIARQAGIPNALVTPAYIHDCLQFLAQIAGDANGGQWGFHLLSARRAQRLSARLRAGALLLFTATIVGVGFRLCLRLAHGPDMLSSGADRWLVVAAASLPALGAALEGIGNQGEFVRIAKRSTAMAAGFATYAAKIAALSQGPPPRLADVIPLAGRIARAMVDEVVDWRTVFIDRSQ